jgi:hypothetical protein
VNASRKFMAVCAVNGPNASGTIRNAVTVNGPITAETFNNLERAIKGASGTVVPRDCSVTIINLIPLEG